MSKVHKGPLRFINCITDPDLDLGSAFFFTGFQETMKNNFL